MAEFSLFRICFTANLTLKIYVFGNLVLGGGTSYFPVIAPLFFRQAGEKKKSFVQSM